MTDGIIDLVRSNLVTEYILGGENELDSLCRILRNFICIPMKGDNPNA